MAQRLDRLPLKGEIIDRVIGQKKILEGSTKGQKVGNTKMSERHKDTEKK